MRCNLEEIEKIAKEDCTCTEEQQTGKDYTVCRSCEASGIIHEIADELEYRLGSIVEKK